jgi:hypothetical protein
MTADLLLEKAASDKFVAGCQVAGTDYLLVATVKLKRTRRAAGLRDHIVVVVRAEISFVATFEIECCSERWR